MNKNDFDEKGLAYLRMVVLDQLRKGNRTVDLAGRNLAPENPSQYEDEALSAGMTLGTISSSLTEDGGVRIKDTYDDNFEAGQNME